MDCSTPSLPVPPFLPEFAKFISIELVIPSNYLILSHPLLLLPSVFPSIRVFSSQLALGMRGQSIGASASASVLPMCIQGWFPLGLTGLISLLSKGLLRVFSSTTIWDHKFLGVQPSYGPTLTSIHDYWKDHSLDYMDLVSKMMPLHSNILSRFVITFLLRSKNLFTSWLQSPSIVILEPKKIKSVTISTFSPSVSHKGWDWILFLAFWMLSFKPTFLLSSFTLIKRLFISSSLSAIRVVSSAYLKLLLFLPAILIPACDSPSLAFSMMYSAYKWNKQSDNIQPWCTPFPIWNQSVVPCPHLTIASWLTYRFLRRQVRWSVIHILFKKFPVCCDPHS